MIAPTPFFEDRGCHVQIYEEARALQKLGHKIIITTYPLGRDHGGLDIRRSVAVPFLKRIKAGPSWVKPFILDPLLFFSALRAALRERPDIIHGHLHEGCLIGWPISRILRRPLVFDLQGSLTGEIASHGFAKRSGVLYWVFHVIEGLVNRLPQAIVTQSTQMVDDLTRNFSIPRNNIMLNYDGVDTEIFAPRSKDGELIRRLGLPQGKRIVVYLGLMNRYQGVDLLLEAIRELDSDSNLHFLIMGGPDSDKYARQAELFGIKSATTFTGFIPYDQAPRYLALGDVAVSLKHDDTEANGKLYNYLAMALPVVASPSQVNREILGSLGIFCSDYEVDGVAGVLKEVAALSGQELKELGMRGREFVSDKYSWDANAKRLEGLYFKIDNERINSKK